MRIWNALSNLQERIEEEEHLYRIPITRGDLIARSTA